MAINKDFAQPWSIREEVLHGLAQSAKQMAGKSSEEMAAALRSAPARKEGYSVVNGVAVIQVHGVLMKDPDIWDRIFMGAISLTEIKAAVEKAADDPEASSIALDIDSPGGTVAGTAEAADSIVAARKKKKVYAFASGLMASGGYWLGSAAEKVYATRTTSVGSIGVYMALWDMSIAAHNAGVEVHIIRAGKFKGMGHPLKQLTEEQRAEMQKYVDGLRGLFVEAVGRQRGLAAAKVEELADGRDWLAAEAVGLGLIDGIGDMQSVLFSGQGEGAPGSAGAKGARASAETVTGAKSQTTTTTKEAAEMADLKDMKLEELRAARPDLAAQLIKEGKDAGVTEGRTAAENEAKAKAQTESDRVKSIFTKAAEIKDVPAAAIEKSISSAETVEAAGNSMKAAKLDAMGSEHPPAMGAENAGENTEKESKDHLARAKKHQADNGGPKKCSITEALKATANKRAGSK